MEETPGSGDVVAGKYRIRRVIGQGGMGRVVEAMHEAVGKPVALKRILDARDPLASGARVRREARAAARVRHANVVDIYDVVEHGGETFIVMELVCGEPLHALLARRGPLEVPEAVALMVEVARGVAAAHRAGVVHRDLKPSNLIVREPGAGVRVTIVDFGISRLEGPLDAVTTGSGGVAGTPQYMAPEQVRGEHVDARADVYAMGAVLYELLTGRPPHVREPVSALLVEIATVAPAPAHLVRPELPVALSEVIGRALAKRPDERYASADDLERALLPFLAEVLGPATLERAAFPPASGERPLDAPTLEPQATLEPRPLDAPTLEPQTQPLAEPRASERDARAPAKTGRWRFAAAALALAVVVSVVAAAQSSRGEPRPIALGAKRAVSEAVEAPREAPVLTGALPAREAPEAWTEPPEQPAPEEQPPPSSRHRARPAPQPSAVRRARGVRTRGISSDEF